MKIFALDDSENGLAMLTDAIGEAVPDAEIYSFTDPYKCLGFTKEVSCDIAFLDIKMWGMNGIEVAVELKKIKPSTNIIFVSAYNEYQGDAFDIHASGYVMKPATKEAILKQIENLRHPVDKKASAKIYVQTFGNFEVFLYGKPITFGLLKSKELFAYLIDRQGASVTTTEIATILWENRLYDISLKNQTQAIISDMRKTLKKNGIEDIIIKSWNQIAVDTTKISCDYYDLMKCDADTVNNFRGEYMVNYGWAEMTAAALSHKTNIY